MPSPKVNPKSAVWILLLLSCLRVCHTGVPWATLSLAAKLTTTLTPVWFVRRRWPNVHGQVNLFMLKRIMIFEYQYNLNMLSLSFCPY